MTSTDNSSHLQFECRIANEDVSSINYIASFNRSVYSQGTRLRYEVPFIVVEQITAKFNQWYPLAEGSAGVDAVQTGSEADQQKPCRLWGEPNGKRGKAGGGKWQLV
jgi:hypothetical protein